MRLKIIGMFMGTLVSTLAVGCGAAYADEAPATASSLDSNLGSRAAEGAAIHKVIDAMAQADLATMAQMYQSSSDPVVHVLSAMAIERIHFNLENATKDAIVCQQTLAGSRPGVALFCGEIEAGDLRLAGRYKEATDKEAALVKQFEGIDKGMDKGLAGMKHYVETDRSAPQFSVDRPAGTITLDLKQRDPKQRADSDISSPTIKAKANGHAIDMIMDSGASSVLLGEEQARTVGVKFSGSVSKTRGWLSNDVPGKHGVLDELSFGGITWHNVPVVVVPRDIALIGVNYLAPLGAIHISTSKLTITSQTAADATCTTPMLAGSSVFGDYLRVLPQLSVEGHVETVLLDTGSHRYLLGSKKALEEVTALRRSKIAFGDIGTSMVANVESAKVNVVISGQPFQVYFDVLSDSDSRWPITLGAGALRDMDFVLDFQNQRMCFPLHADLH